MTYEVIKQFLFLLIIIHYLLVDPQFVFVLFFVEI